jgi:hypothetical protein
MPFDVLTSPSNIRMLGPISMANDQIGSSPTQAVATGTATILIPVGVVSLKLSAAAATTGATLPQGTVDGQLLWLTITTAAANTVTFAAAGTSFVAGGAAVSLAGLATHLLRWDAGSSLWFQVGPLAN